MAANLILIESVNLSYNIWFNCNTPHRIYRLIKTTKTRKTSCRFAYENKIHGSIQGISTRIEHLLGGETLFVRRLFGYLDFFPETILF